MLTGYKRIELDPRVQIVINMDGWGPPWLKRESYRAYVYSYPVEYTGFKLFYKNDTKKKGEQADVAGRRARAQSRSRSTSSTSSRTGPRGPVDRTEPGSWHTLRSDRVP